MATSFIQELKRRNVFRVVIIYIVVSWLLMQIGDVMFPALLLPDWTSRMLVAFLILGLPMALIFAWAYEITPDGIKKTRDVVPDDSITSTTGRKIDFLIIGILTIAVVTLGIRVWTDGGTPPVQLAGVPEKSIAVLPFKNQSASAENAEFFATGVHDELLTLLSKIGELKVISRTSVERLDPGLSTPEIGTLLGVATVLEGQVQRAGDQLRINVQLINTADDDHLWANIYDRELTAGNIFAVQSDIARTIVDSLHATLSVKDEAILSTAPTENLEALEHYMLGSALMKRGSFSSLSRAVQYFEDATRLDPNYAEAWVALAHAQSRMYQTGAIELQEYVAVAEPAVTRALAEDNVLPAAHAEQATLYWRAGNIDAAEASFKHALELKPGDSESLFAYGSYLRYVGRSVEAVPVLEEALDGDPLNVEKLFEFGKAEMYAGRPEKNAIQAEKILEIDPSSVHGYVAYLQAYLSMGRFDLAWPWYLKAMDSDPDDHELWAHAAYFATLLGARDWPDQYMRRAIELGAKTQVVLKCRIHTHMLRDEFEDALAIARDALDAHLDDRWFSKNLFLRMLRDDALRANSIDSAEIAYREHRPGLFETSPEITVDNVYAAADLAYLLQIAGQPERAGILIDTAMEWYEKSQPAGAHGYITTIADVQLFALKGDKRRALDTLREAVDAGWAYDWSWHINNRNLDSLREEPEFQTIVAELESKMAAQLKAVEALPDMGELDLRYK